MEAGLRACKGGALINSTSLNPGRLESLAPLAVEYYAGLIGLTLGEEGIPRDANERGFLVACPLKQGMVSGFHHYPMRKGRHEVHMAEGGGFVASIVALAHGR